MKKQYLVTGGTGLVGSHMLILLTEKNISPVAIYRTKEKLEKVKNLFRLYDKGPLFSKIHWIPCDVTDRACLEDIIKETGVIFHAAAKVSFLPRHRKEMFNTNILGTENMVNLALEHQVSYFLHVSSIAALGGNSKIKSEKAIWSWNVAHTGYGASKFLSEMEVWRGFQEGLKGAIINPSVIIGPGFWDSGFGKLIDRVAKEKLYFYSEGKTGYTDVRDTVQIMWLLFEKNITEERFIINADNKRFSEIISMLAEFLGVKPPHYKLPEKLTRAMITPINILSTLMGKGKILDKAAINALFEDSEYENSKIKEALNYEFIPVEDSLKFAVEMYKKDKG